MYSMSPRKTTVLDPDNIWAHWSMMILTRHNLPTSICQLTLVPDTHMYTNVTLTRTVNDTEFTRKNKSMVSVSPRAADLPSVPQGMHPNPPIPHPPILHPTGILSCLSDSGVKSTWTGQAPLTVRPSCQGYFRCDRVHICCVCNGLLIHTDSKSWESDSCYSLRTRPAFAACPLAELNRLKN